jgi:hypothetical protein
MRQLTTLDLELDLETQISNKLILILAAAARSCSRLRVLKIRTGPEADLHFKEKSEAWAPLLQLLGSDPPFRLHTLEIDGLVSSMKSPTLAHIVDVHASTLRHILLHHLNFHYPNTAREFFAALSRSNINYFFARWFKLHGRGYLTSSTLACRFLSDEILEFHAEGGIYKDWSYQGWVDIEWNVHHIDQGLVYDWRDGGREHWGVKETFMEVVELVDCGAIRDI